VYGQYFATGHLGLDLTWNARALGDCKCREEWQEEGVVRRRSKEVKGDTQTEPPLRQILKIEA